MVFVFGLILSQVLNKFVRFSLVFCTMAFGAKYMDAAGPQ